MGVVSPAGSKVDSMWDRLIRSEGTLAEAIEYPGGLHLTGSRAAEFAPTDRYPAHELRRLDRAHQMAIWAADDAVAELELVDPSRTAVVIGVGYGAAGYAEKQHARLAEAGWRGVSPNTIPIVMPSSIASHLSLRYGFTGPCLTTSAACASGSVAIGEALWLLRSGRADRVLCGGVDALHTYAASAFFNRMGALADPTEACSAASAPFSPHRTGFVLGEGAGMLVLDRDESLSAYGLVAGYATNNDSHHLVAPDPDGAGAARCMQDAVRDAGLSVEAIGHINAHGTSTMLNDRVEANAITEVFPSRPPVVAPKASIGHLVGGAGAVEAIISLLALRHQQIPPTPNYLADPDLPSLKMSTRSQPVSPTSALSNSFAFGGINASIVLRGLPA